MKAQPPGPGLPRQAPSVKSCTRARAAGAAEESSVESSMGEVCLRGKTSEQGRAAKFVSHRARRAPTLIEIKSGGKTCVIWPAPIAGCDIRTRSVREASVRET